MPIGIRLPNAAGMTLADVTAIVQVATQPLQQQVADAKTAAQNAQTTATTAKTTADAAQSTITTTLAPGYTSLSETAATVQSLNAASVADRAQLNTRMAALEAKTWTVQRQTVSTQAALALGATVDLTVTWSPAMPDLNYLVSVTPDATGVLLSDIVAVKSKSTTAVVVTVKALVALTSGVKVIVEAGRWG